MDPRISPFVGADFSVVVKDDSMSPTFAEGDVVYCRADSAPQPGRLVVVAFKDGTYAIRRLYITPQHVWLKADNPLWPPLCDGFDDWLIVGQAVGFSREL